MNEFECKECGRLLDDESPYCQDCDRERYDEWEKANEM